MASRWEGGACGAVAALLTQRKWMQLGGNETVGQGWFLVHPLTAASEG